MTAPRLLLFVFLVWVCGCLSGVAWMRHRAAAQTHQAVQAAEPQRLAAETAAERATTHDHALDLRQTDREAEARKVVHLQRELEILQHQAPAPPEPAQSDAPPPVANPVEAKKDELLQAQAQRILGLERDLGEALQARDDWRATAHAREREALQLRAALAAQAGLIRAAELKGFGVGLLVGGGAGYAGGRR
jgi:hypothetical protein